MRLGATHTDASKALISQSKVGNKYCVGRQISHETRAKIGAASRLRARPKEVSAAVESQRQRFKRVLKSVLRPAKIRKRESTSAALGYTRERLVAHIEAQFAPGMSWADRKTFSIDHKVPVVEFIRRGITDPKIVSSLANLGPMVPRDNRVKSDRYDGDFASDLAAILKFNAELAA